MTHEAAENGLPENKQNQLRIIVESHQNVFRTGLSAGPPVKIPPLKIDLVSDARPARVKLRKYSQDQREILGKLCKKLIQCGMIYSNPSSPWACAPLLVPKPGPSLFRFTTDLRPVNRYMIRYQYPMPNLEQELVLTSWSKYYDTVDFSHGYWQLPLHPDSQASQSFVTPDGVFYPTRVYMAQLMLSCTSNLRYQQLSLKTYASIFSGGSTTYYSIALQ